jgi:hypothetical protein
LRLRSGRGRSLYILFQSVASLYCFNLSSTSFSLLQVFPVDKPTAITTTQQNKTNTLFAAPNSHSLSSRNIHIPSAKTYLLTHRHTLGIRIPEPGLKHHPSSHIQPAHFRRHRPLESLCAYITTTSRRTHQAAIRQQIDQTRTQ